MPDNDIDTLSRYEELIAKEPELGFEEILERLNTTEDEKELLRVAHRLKRMGSADIPHVTLDPDDLLSRTPKLEVILAHRPAKWRRIILSMRSRSIRPYSKAVATAGVMSSMG